MRTLIAGMAAAIILAIVAGFVFSSAREPVHTVYSSSSTRVGEPGSNLVGKAWTGNPRIEASDGQAGTGTRSGAPN
jgi:hypothetical protein